MYFPSHKQSCFVHTEENVCKYQEYNPHFDIMTVVKKKKIDTKKKKKVH